MRVFVISIIFLIVGIVFGIGITKILPNINIESHNEIYTYLHIRKPQIIGFQPFWLLNKAKNDYSKYITTYAYFGLTIGPQGKLLKKVNSQEEEPGWTHFKSAPVKSIYSSYKKDNITRSILLHQSNENSIIKLMSNPDTHARNLINDITPYMNTYSLNDINIDIESFIEASPEAQLSYADFIKEVKQEIVKNNLGTLTIDISPTAFVKDFLINPRLISDIPDYVVLMTYDYHYLGSTLSGPVAPIGGAETVREFDVETGLKEALKVFPKEKIILGIPLYGYEWETIYNSPQSATVPKGASLASSRRVSEVLKNCTDCKKGFDDIAKQPYVIFPDEAGNFFHQIFYENERSIKEKLKLAEKYEIGGVALWALGYEDNNILNPLLSFKNRNMIKD